VSNFKERGLFIVRARISELEQKINQIEDKEQKFTWKWRDLDNLRAMLKSNIKFLKVLDPEAQLKQ